jgi:hypothetical protein
MLAAVWRLYYEKCYLIMRTLFLDAVKIEKALHSMVRGLGLLGTIRELIFAPPVITRCVWHEWQSVRNGYSYHPSARLLVQYSNVLPSSASASIYSEQGLAEERRRGSGHIYHHPPSSTNQRPPVLRMTGCMEGIVGSAQTTQSTASYGISQAHKTDHIPLNKRLSGSDSPVTMRQGTQDGSS